MFLAPGSVGRIGDPHAPNQGGWWSSAYGSDVGLVLDFVNNRTFNNGVQSTPKDLLTYTAPSPKIVTGSDGLLNYAGNNLALYSGTLTDASWSKTNGSYAGGKLTEDGAAGLHAISRTVTVTAGRLIASVRLKAGGRSAGRLFIGNTNGFQVNFDLSVPSVSGGANVGTGVYESAGVIDLGNGEYRVWIAGRAADAASVLYVYLNNGVSVSYTGDGTSGMFINEVQVGLSSKSLPGTYLATTSAARYALPIDYDPLTGASLGVLIEEQRTNLLLRSQEFDNAAWTKGNTTISANAVAAPDGTMTADAMLTTAVTGVFYAYQLVTTTAAAYTFSVYVKPNGYNFVFLFNGATGNGRVFNVATGAKGGTAGNAAPTSDDIVSVGNGWYRCSITMTCTAVSSSFLVYAMASDSGSASFTADGTSGLYIWGAQTELGAFATSYIPTVASQVTRAADQLSLATSAFGFSNVAGSVASEQDTIFETATVNGLVYLYNSASNLINLYTYPNRVGLAIVTGGVSQCDLSPGSGQVNGVPFKQAAAWALNDVAQTVNGAAVQTDTSVSIPTDITTLYLGCRITTSQNNGHIKSLAYWPTRKTNAYLQQVTV